MAESRHPGQVVFAVSLTDDPSSPSTDKNQALGCGFERYRLSARTAYYRIEWFWSRSLGIRCGYAAKT